MDDNITTQQDSLIEYKFFNHSQEYLHIKDEFLLDRFLGILAERDIDPHDKNCAFLEIGFAYGERLMALAKRFPNSKFTGLETRDKCVRTLREKGYDCRQVHEEIFPISERFDVIYGYSVLHHISCPYQYLEHLFSLLNPGGIIVFQNEPHAYDFIALGYTTLTRTWKFEKHLLKLSKRKLIKSLKRYANYVSVTYDGLPSLMGLKKINAIYALFKFHRIPFFNNLTIVAQKSKMLVPLP